MKVTISVGISSYPDNPLDSLIKRADDALYRAKKEGRNKVVLFQKPGLGGEEA